MIILDGKIVRSAREDTLKKRITSLSRKPVVLIIQIGRRADSTIYIEQKKKCAQSIGAIVRHVVLPASILERAVIEVIKSANLDPSIDGIIVQLPVPSHIDPLSLIDAIDYKKDIDGLTDDNQEKLREGKPYLVPATARGVMSLLDYYHIDPKGKKVTVVGRSRLVGYPIALLLSSRGADVSVCHSQTKNPKEVTRTADILVVAIGRPEHIDRSYVKEGAVVVDVGINVVGGQKSKVKNKKLEEEIPKRNMVGDVDFQSVAPIASAISKVPGGVGPMTVVSLFENLVDATEYNLAHYRDVGTE